MIAKANIGAPYAGTGRIGDGALASRLSRELRGEILFDPASRGRYSTDASIYQIEPIGVVIPKGKEDIVSAIQIAGDEDIPILPRGAGTSQCGQTVGEALVLDVSKNFGAMISLDKENRRITVQPGVVLDQLNAYLKPHGLFFPVDVSTSSRATIGGMTANNSCGDAPCPTANNISQTDLLHQEASYWLNGMVPLAVLLKNAGITELPPNGPGLPTTMYSSVSSATTAATSWGTGST